jgi:predicted chitinase
MITESQLQQIMPALPATKRQQYLPHLNEAMQEFGIDSMLRTAAFLAQLAHESAQFRFMEEIWGPTDAQRRYEPVTKLAERLGNTQPGDGLRYKGRGPIQITGRANYRRYGELLGKDLEASPETASAPEIGFAIAALYWATNRLNELADKEDFLAITKRINGGTNGLEERERYYARAKEVLGQGFSGGSRGRQPSRIAVDVEPLQRGFEVISNDS